MDSITHIALGACIGKIVLPQKLGKKALILGAISHSIPDIDVVSTFFNSETQDLLLHRSITHSLFIAIIFALLFASFGYIQTKKEYRFTRLFFPFLLLVGLHDILDTCNNYGTELFSPFSSKRYSFHLLYVVDPLFTIAPLIIAIILFLKNKKWQSAIRWSWFGLVIPCIYLFAIGMGKLKVMNKLESNAPANNAKFNILTPSPFNSLLWYGIFSTDSAVYTTYSSVFDKKERVIQYHFFPKNDTLLTPFAKDEDAQNLMTFSEGLYTIQKNGDSTVFCIPRFGQIMGWQYPQAPFTFYYYLSPDTDNSLTMQRGRLKGWNKETIGYYFDRILGR